MIIALLFLILFAILLPGVMRFIFAMFGLFIIALFMIAAAHAEPAGPGDVIIHDRSNYEICRNASNRLVQAAPPYYIALFCLHGQCNNFTRVTFCTMGDCHNQVAMLHFGPPAELVCATSDGVGGYEIEVKGTASDEPSANDTAAECDPAFVTVNAILVEATMKCGVNYMDTKVGNDVNALAHACDVKLGPSKIHSLMHTAIRGWENNYKSDKKEACENTDKAFRAIEAASAPQP